ncbi:type IX secretion system sortase PorU [Flavobacterium sp. IMCC34852]|uniref:Type IX secretion system sortase PorU n=1 Tax=Flavobacterium rivulicola TaxID=2732161 RepID=A0A7Y3RB37_9FLAO|nr:type IX secretion system sortase PorU [Flavobacterium sp. IMCC34852]NNT73235.1 type IX secretion system sortase PorU [Flavobacterium sp. IMCC34852]
MKKISTVLLLFVTIIGFSQVQGNITLNWTEKKGFSHGDSSFNIPQFNPENYQFDSYTKTVSFLLTLNLIGVFDENSIQIRNLVYETISENQLGDLDPKNIPTAFNYKFKTNIARDKFYGQLVVSPIIKDGNDFKKLVSFSYNIQQNQNNRNNNTANNVNAIQNSVLSSGNWYRFYVEKSGVYKITKNFLRSLGLDTTVDPRKIKIYGSGGKMLPLLNATAYPIDLEENAIQFIGETDGVFDSQDYILFYAEGFDNWNDDYKTNLNIYAEKAYYYVTATGSDNGKRIVDLVQPSGSADTIITTFDDYQFHETEKTNFARLGRIWFGEDFNTDNEQEFDFTFPNLVTATPIRISVHAGSAAFTPTSFKVEANSQLVGNINMSALSPTGSTKILVGISTNDVNVSSENVTVKITYDNGGVPGSRGYLDFINIKAKRNLQGYGKQFRFQYDQANSLSGIGEFQLSNASGISQVWDITDIYNVTKVENTTQNSFSFKSNLGEIRKYIAIDSNDFFSPSKESKSKVDNQNLKGTIFNNAQGQFQDIDYLIVTPKDLNAQAEKLANFHRNYSGLNVKVVNLENIYHEFSSGKQDISAIRNFVKYVYDNGSSNDSRVKYLNLFGDGSFDFKDRIPNNTNIVPTYQGLNGFTESEASFTSDDFFGMMSPDEGRLDFGFLPLNGTMTVGYDFGGIDIAVGRMIVSSVQQAEEMVNKVIEYHDIKSYGSWRNIYVAIGDDPNADQPSDRQLQFYQNRLADRIALEKPFINTKKILLDSYVQETSAGGKRYPKAREDIFASFEKGALVFNYLGHGGEDGLSEERIWEKSDGQNLANRYKYPLFITITCEFSRFDNPYRPTAGEYTFWNPRGGAISMITTVRSIGQSTAQYFNDVLAQYLFAYGSNQYTSIAEALRLAKNTGPNSATNIVFYLGDPALMLAIPKPKIVLTKVNDMPITGPIDDFKSLSYMKLSGEVLDQNNNLLSTYNGELSVNIFDKTITVNTLRNDGSDAMVSLNGPLATTMPFTALGETIFRGNASINNGQFEFGFVVPRDIRIPLDYGRISFYSKRNQILLDKTGYNTDIKIGGINPNAEVDNIGPTVKLYMNDETFVNGGITNASPFLLAILEDANGINTASGIGHDIVGILDGDESNPYIMNDYYETELDDYTKGRVYFPYRNLAPGLHTITFKAWDVYNNPITAEIQFIVIGDENVAINNVLNYPNPFVNYTEFWFSHNRPFEPLEVQVQVMTITGKIVWSKNQTVTTDGFLCRDITWDGKDDFGDRIGKGVYVYKLTVKSTLSNKKAEKIEKLVIL